MRMHQTTLKIGVCIKTIVQWNIELEKCSTLVTVMNIVYIRMCIEMAVSNEMLILCNIPKYAFNNSKDT